MGRGLTFKHPNDRQHSFNVDYSLHYNEDRGTWGLHPLEGHHVDVKSPHLKVKIRISTYETYEANRLAYLRGEPRPYKMEYIPQPKPFPQPAERQFQQTLQQTKLTDSYNASAQKPVPEKGMTGGSIGGVATAAEYIEGLFDSPEALFECEHVFCMPLVGDQLPFSNDELKQIIRELTAGIYTYGTFPFFSLHFKQGSADLYPVIHLAYQNTLVGRVIGLLDYFMKGYLNGGTFTEKFIDDWHKDPNWERKSRSALQELIDFERHCSQLPEEDRQYISLSALKKNITTNPMIKNLLRGFLPDEEQPESRVLADFEGFKNSFRIIAKQNSLQKSGNVFMIDSDFDVEYTIEPSPKYLEALAKYQRKHNALPASYQRLVASFEMMKMRIHTHMQKLPLCKKYFSLLGMIDFFSCYLSTMKKHGKMPHLPPFKPAASTTCPPLFPHLPITIQTKEPLRFNANSAIKKFKQLCTKQWLKSFFIEMYNNMQSPWLFWKQPNKRQELNFNPAKITHFTQILQQAIEQNLLTNSSPPFKRFIQTNRQAMQLDQLIAQIAKKYKNEILNAFHSLAQNYQMELGTLPKEEMVNMFITKIEQAIPNQMQKISEDIPYQSTMINSELPKNELEKHKKIVGGCGLRMEKKSLQPSKMGKLLLHSQWRKMQEMPTETWQNVLHHGSKRGMFKLKFQDVPLELSSDYSWMQEHLLHDTDENSLKNISRMLRIREIITEQNFPQFCDFLRNISGNELANMKDQNGASLLCYAAQVDTEVYLNYLVADKNLSLQIADKNGYLPIHYAAMADSIKTLAYMLNKDASLAGKVSKNGSIPLTVAIQNSSGEAIKLLSNPQKSYPVETNLVNGYTNLHSALHNGNFVFTLFRNNQFRNSINVCSEEGGTPLMLACELDNLRIIKQLIAWNANIRAKRRDGMTAIEIACRRQCLPVLKELLSKEKPSNSAVEAALKEGTIEIVEEIAKHVNLSSFKNSCGDNPAHISVRSGNLKVAFYFAHQYPSLFTSNNANNEKAYNLALAINAWDLVTVLFDQHKKLPDIYALLKSQYHPKMRDILPKIDIQPNHLFSYVKAATRPGMSDVAELLFVHPQMNSDNIPPQTQAQILPLLAKTNALEIFKKLFAGQTEMRHEGKTLAYIAAENASYGVFHFLWKYYENNHLSYEQHFGSRHLFYGILQTGDLDSINVMLQLYPKLQHIAMNSGGQRLVHAAAEIGKKHVLEYLSQKGTDFHVYDDHQKSPLYCAIANGHEKCARYLLTKHHIPITSEDLYCAASGSDELFQTVISHGRVSQKILDHVLFLAILDTNVEAMTRLKSGGAHYDYISPKGWTPLLISANMGRFDILQEILQNLAQNSPEHLHYVNDEGNGALHLACKAQNAACVDLLLKAGFSPDQKNKYKQTPSDLCENHQTIFHILHPTQKYGELLNGFSRALAQGDVKEIEKFFNALPKQENILLRLNNILCASPLLLAIRFCSDLNAGKIIAWINQYNFAVNLQDEKGRTIAHYLVQEGISPIAIEGLRLDIPDHEGVTPLHLAAGNMNTTVLDEVLESFPGDHFDQTDRLGRSPLFYALETKIQQNLQLVLNKEVNLQRQDAQGLTPILKAIQINWLTAVKILIQKGADPNGQGKNGTLSPLMFAIFGGYKEIARFLLMQGALPDQVSEEGFMPIHAAARNKDIEILRLFSSNRNNIYAQDDFGKTVVHYAAQYGNTAALSFLHQLDQEIIHVAAKPTFKDDDDKQIANLKKAISAATPLHFASMNGKTQTVQWLLEHYANPEAKTESDYTPVIMGMQSQIGNDILKLYQPYTISTLTDTLSCAIMESIKQDNVDTMISLMGKGFPRNIPVWKKYSALHLASSFSALQCTSWLLQNNEDPMLIDPDSMNALEIAAGKGSHEQLLMMIHHAQPDIDARYNQQKTLLHHAAEGGHFLNVLTLIQSGASLDFADLLGFTPLHLATERHDIETIKLLLALGANDHLKTQFHKTAEEMAEIDAVRQVFVDHKKSIEQSDPSQTQLHFAVRSENEWATKILAAVTDINMQDNFGMTPLHFAVKMENPEIILTLLRYGADGNITNKIGQTPLMIAQGKNLWIKEALCDLLQTG